MAGYFYVQPKHIWENIDAPKDYRGEDAVIGCGPYRFVSLDEDAQTSYYEAVSDTYLGREVTVKKVSLRSFDSNDALVMALRNGEIDAMYSYASPIPATMASSITGVEHVEPGMSDNTGSYMIMFGFRKGPTDDLNFRKAVTLSLDYELLADAIGGEDARYPVGVIAPPNLGYDETLPKLEQNLEAAKAALDEGGYLDVDGDGYREMPDGSPWIFWFPPRTVAHAARSTCGLQRSWFKTWMPLGLRPMWTSRALPMRNMRISSARREPTRSLSATALPECVSDLVLLLLY